MNQYDIIEKVGISSKSYSDAVRNAINNVKKDISWFEVIEFRGRMNKETIEYQVIVKIGL